MACRMSVQIISFQNLLELTQDLVVVLKDHGFLPKASKVCC